MSKRGSVGAKGTKYPALSIDYDFPAISFDDKMNPIITRYKFRDFPPHMYKRKTTAVILDNNYLYSNEWRCFISGVQCYYVHKDLFSHSMWHTAWGVSLDHLVPRGVVAGTRHLRASDPRVNDKSNKSVVGRKMNKVIGHAPFPVKLLFKQVLSNETYSRDDMSYENFRNIKLKIVETANQYKTNGRLLWEPWACDVESDRIKSEKFMEEMFVLEEEFLNLDVEGKKEWIEKFQWKW